MVTGAQLDSSVWFRTICKQNGLEVGDDQLTTMQNFAGQLLEWNKKINLISRKDEENIWTGHILHSATILFKLRIPPNAVVLDLGTGGGLPGIPLKILLPTISITLLDSTQKKINVVNDLISSLRLKGATAVWGRAENLGGKKEFFEKFDLVVVRAVASLKDLVTWSYPFLKKRHDPKSINENTSLLQATPPSLIALKGGDLHVELEGIEKDQRIRSVKVLDLTLKGSDQLDSNDKKIVLIGF